MRILTLLLLLSLFPSCGGSPGDDPAAAPPELAPGETPALFSVDDCTSISPAEIQRVLGAEVATVSVVPPPFVPPGTCTREFRVDLTDGGKYHLKFDIGPISAAELEQEMLSFEANARDMPDLIEYEASTDRVTQIGTDRSRHRLYAFNPSAGTLPILTYYTSGREGSQPPKQAEARRRSAIRLLNYLLTH